MTTGGESAFVDPGVAEDWRHERLACSEFGATAVRRQLARRARASPGPTRSGPFDRLR